MARGITWPDFDIAPELRAVGGAGGDGGGGIGMEQAEAQEREEQSKQPVVWRGRHVQVQAGDEAPPVCG